MSAGVASIARIEHFVHDVLRGQQIQGVGVGELDHIGNELFHLSRHLWTPGCEFFVQFLGDVCHD
jgi:hypothetical protein